jgi:hypothetical protein
MYWQVSSKGKACILSNRHLLLIPHNNFDTSSQASRRELILIDSISLEANGDCGAAAELLRDKWKTSEGIESAEGPLPGQRLH